MPKISRHRGPSLYVPERDKSWDGNNLSPSEEKQLVSKPKKKSRSRKPVQTTENHSKKVQAESSSVLLTDGPKTSDKDE